jgi:hypothetical protein
MPNTLEDVIDYCNDQYGLHIRRAEREEYLAVLKRHRKEINGYHINRKGKRKVGFPMFKHLADYLILYSYLSGKTPVNLGEGKKRKIGTLDDLYLMSVQNVGTTGQNPRYDLLLARTYGRIQQRQIDNGFPKLPQIIDYLGKKSINKRFGLKSNDSLYNRIVLNQTVKYFEREKHPGLAL